jgi:multidrug resistance efflux pump
VPAPIDGTVLKRQAAEGKFVKAGEELAQVADPSTIMVEAIVQGRYLDDMRLGDTVKVLLVGDDSEVLGTVKEIKLSDDAEDATLAYQFRSTYANSFRVLIALDASHQRPVLVGQSAKIMDIGQHAGWVKRSFAWAYSKVKF